MTKEQIAILNHTAHRAANGLYCGDSPDMQELVRKGLMVYAGRMFCVPDKYFRMTNKGLETLRQCEDATIKASVLDQALDRMIDTVQTENMQKNK